MAITKSKKAEQLAELEAQFKSAQGIAFAECTRLTVDEAQSVRRELREKGMTYKVIKKTLIALAAKNTGVAEFSVDDLSGSVSVIVSSSDEIAPAAAIKKFKKDFFNKATKESKMDFAGCIFNGMFQNAAQTAVIAETPTREESLGRIVGMLKSGPQKIHGVLNSGFRKLHNVLENAEKFAS